MAAGIEPPSSKFSFIQTLPGSYDISNELLNRISCLVSAAIGTPTTVEIKLDNGAKLEAEIIDVVLSDSILETTLIDEVWLRASAARDGLVHSAMVYATTSGRPDGVTIYLQGRKEGVTALRNELDAYLRGGRQWYWPVNYGDNFFVFAIRIIIAFAISLLLAWAALKPMPSSWFGESPNSVLFTFCCLVFCLFLFAGDVRKYFFPKVSFSIGKGRRRRSLRNNVLRFIASTVIVGLIMSVVGNKLSDWLSAKS